MSAKAGRISRHAGIRAAARCTGASPLLPCQPPSATAAPPPCTAGLEQEFTFSRADFERVRQLIYQRAGISLHAGKQAMVYSRLSRRLRETGHRSFSDYLQWLRASARQRRATPNGRSSSTA